MLSYKTAQHRMLTLIEQFGAQQKYLSACSMTGDMS